MEKVIEKQIAHCAVFIFLIQQSSCSFVIRDNKNISSNTFIPSIPQLLEGVTPCDVRILMDGLQEFRFDSDYNWPTTVIFVPAYFNKYYLNDYSGYATFEKLSFLLNIIQTKVQFCVVNLLLIGNQDVLQSPTHEHNINKYDEENYKYIRHKSGVSMSLYLTIAYNHVLRHQIQFNSKWFLDVQNIYTILITTQSAIWCFALKSQ